MLAPPASVRNDVSQATAASNCRPLNNPAARCYHAHGMAAHNFLAFDVGAESGRAVLGSLGDGRLTLEERHRFPNPTGRVNGHLYWNLLAQWEELKTGLRKATEGHVGARASLSGIGVDTWGVDFGLVGADGDVIGNPFHYRDPRTDGVMERAFQRVSRQEIFEHTGVQFMQLNSLYQLLALRDTKPRTLDGAETLLFIPDLFNYLFTGERRAEFSIETTSQMYAPRKGTWATEMPQKLALPTRIFPPIIPSGTTIGPLRRDVAEECNVG